MSVNGSELSEKRKRRSSQDDFSGELLRRKARETMEYTFKARLFHRHVTSISAQLLHAPLVRPARR